MILTAYNGKLVSENVLEVEDCSQIETKCFVLRTFKARGFAQIGKRPPMVEGMRAEEFIQHNADPMWLHQNEMWECL